MIRANLRNSSIPLLIPTRKVSSSSVLNSKKTLLKPIPPNKPNNSNEADTEKQPISDFPAPPVPIVSFLHGQPGEMIPLPQINTAPHGEIPQLALQKLKQCCRSIDFSDKQTEAASKVTKKATLNELIDCYSNPKMFSRLTRECHQQLIEMFAANVFRPQPNIPRAIIMSDDAVYVDTAWSHLNLVYILFLKFLDCNIDPRILQFKLDPKFISSLFAILDFPDERERTQAKNVIAKIHAKVPPQRKILYQLTLNLLHSVPEGFEMNAASHLLDLFYTFTSSTPPPLPQSLLQAFEKVLLPLHLSERCQRYFQSLVRCNMMLVRKDIRLGNSLIHFLVEHWPLTLDHKSELFIEEISHLLDDSMPKCIDQNIEEVMRCICISAESSCTTLANKALKFMLNNRIQNLIVEMPEKILSIIFPTLFRIAREHWQRNLQLNALNVMNALVELVPIFFTQAAAKFKDDVLAETHRKEQKKKMWEYVAQIAIENDHSIDAEAVNCEFSDFYGEGKTLPKYLLQARLNYQHLSLSGRSGSLVDFQLSDSRSQNNSGLIVQEVAGIVDDGSQSEESSRISNLNINQNVNESHRSGSIKSERKDLQVNNPSKRRRINHHKSTPILVQQPGKSPISFPVEKDEEDEIQLLNSKSIPNLTTTPHATSDSEDITEIKEEEATNQNPNQTLLPNEKSETITALEPKSEDNVLPSIDNQSSNPISDQVSNQNPNVSTQNPVNSFSIVNHDASLPTNSSTNQNLSPNINHNQKSNLNSYKNSNTNSNFGITSEINQNINASTKSPFSDEYFTSGQLKTNSFQGDSLMRASNSFSNPFGNITTSLFNDSEAIKEEDENQSTSSNLQNNMLTIIEE